MSLGGMGMANGKLGYYADFILYAAVLLAMVALGIAGSRANQLTWLEAAFVGAASWTLLEYVLHRVAFHRLPIIADFHDAHHASPRAYLHTPTWITLLLLAFVFFVPLWRLFSLTVALGTTSGLIAGWLWYGVVHHVIHHRRPRWLAAALRSASHRHFRHHAVGSSNFGVTTSVWDFLFRTIESGRRSSSPARSLQ
jgi:sterol desaturase/sphingolipid hydroxylase (fatty acid hydroxylase superfamily)